MAMENKRIIQLSTERLTLNGDDYVMVDSETDGSAKYRLDRLKETDTTLSVSGMAADAAATGQAISDEATARGNAVSAEAEARAAAVTAEAQARALADNALGNDVQDLKSALKAKVNGYSSSEYNYPDYRIDKNGSLVGDRGCEATGFITCEPEMAIQWYGKSFYYDNAPEMCCIAFYDGNKSFLYGIVQVDGSTATTSQVGYISTTVPASAKYFRASTRDQNGRYCWLFDVQNRLNELFNVDFGTFMAQQRVLTNEDDLNNTLAPGMYSYSSASRPSNAPNGISYGGLVTVFAHGNVVEQYCFFNIDSQNTVAYRIKTSVWSDWRISRNAYEFIVRGTLTSANDLNNILTPGTYEYASNNIPTNAPVAKGGMLIVFRSEAAREQQFFNLTDHYRRYYTPSGTWGSWIKLANENEVSKRFDSIKYPSILNISGNGSTAIQKEIKLVSGNSYRVDVINPVWNHTASASGVSIFWLRSSDGTHKVFDYLGSAERVNTPTIFTARSTDYLLDVRADVNESVFIVFTDVTSSGSGGTEYVDNSHLNVFKYTHQLGLLEWTPKSAVMTGEGERSANVKVTGAPYSSVKEYHKYIGADVSIHTFMTAVNDPHSLFYTEYVNENGSQSAYGRTYHGTNATCYFGSVCSALVSLAIGKKSQIASWEYQTIKEEFDILQNQSVLALNVGDIISYNGHCCIITKIDRNGNGSMETIEMDEHAAPVVMKTYAPSVLEDRASFHSGAWCRYKYLDMNTGYRPSPFVLLEGESVYNRGDFVFIDSALSRTYYRSINSNSDSTFTSTNWTQIPVYTPGTEYKRNFDNPVFVSLGDHLYKCIKTHTASAELDPTKWEEIKGVFEWAAYPYVYNDDICTFAGDRASFRTNDLIYIDYTKGSYTSMQLYKDGTLIQTITLPDSGYQIDVSSYCTGAGLYKARLTDGTNYSRYTYFEVIDTTVTATYSNGFATINFSSTNGKPIDVQIPEINGRYTCHVTPTDDEIAKGQIIICPKARMYAETYIYPDRYEGFSKTVYARVIFEGEYGNAANDKIELGNLEAEVGDIVYPDMPKELGTLTGNNSVILNGRMTGNRYSFSFVAGSSASVAVYPAIGSIVWKTALPANLTNGTTYLVSVENGIGDVVSVI